MMKLAVVAAAAAIIIIGLALNARADGPPMTDATPREALNAELGRLLERGLKVWRPEYFAAGDTPDGAREDLAQQTPAQAIAAARAHLEAARADDPNFVAKALVIVDKFEAAINLRIEAETKCRATPACMGPRIAATTCAAIAARRADLQSIAEEKKNPGGVVDLAKLHGLGQEVQMLDGQIADAKKRYLATVKKAFTEQLCVAPAPAASSGAR